MSVLKQLRLRLAGFFRKKQFDADMAEELRERLARRVQANLAAGLSADEASAAAQRQCSGVDQFKEIARYQRGWSRLKQFTDDERSSSRVLRDPNPCQR